MVLCGTAEELEVTVTAYDQENQLISNEGFDAIFLAMEGIEVVKEVYDENNLPHPSEICQKPAGGEVETAMPDG